MSRLYTIHEMVLWCLLKQHANKLHANIHRVDEHRLHLRSFRSLCYVQKWFRLTSPDCPNGVILSCFGPFIENRLITSICDSDTIKASLSYTKLKSSRETDQSVGWLDLATGVRFPSSILSISYHNKAFREEQIQPTSTLNRSTKMESVRLVGIGRCVHSVRIGSGALPPSCPMGAGGSFPGVEAAGSCGCPFTCIRWHGQVELCLHSPKYLHDVMLN